MESLRPKRKYNVVFPEIDASVTPEEMVRWKTEIEAIWDGWTVTWYKLGERVYGISCEPKDGMVSVQ